MPININSTEGQAVRKLVPLSTLPNVHFEILCAEVDVKVLPKGDVLFRRGEKDDDLVYLLAGKVSLQSEDLQIEVIEAGSDSALFALAHQIPRKIDAVALETVRFLKVPHDMIYHPDSLGYKDDSNDLDEMSVGIDSDDWMTALLQSPVFLQLPPANLQKMLESMEEVRIKKGDVIVNQGDQGCYYHLIKSGRCLLTRKAKSDGREIKLAQLKVSDSFGEDALISGQPANETVTALDDMELMRLDKKNFEQLIKQPSICYIDYKQLKDEVAKGAVLMDVRHPEEFHRRHLEKSINVPLYSVRLQLKNMQRTQKIIVVCGNGRLASAAAFLMLKNNFTSYVLEGGLEQVPAEQQNTQAIYQIDDGVEINNLLVQPETEVTTDQTEPAEQSEQSYNYVEWEEVNIHEQRINALTARNEEIEQEKLRLKELCLQLERKKNKAENQLQLLDVQTEKINNQIKRLRVAATIKST